MKGWSGQLPVLEIHDQPISAWVHEHQILKREYQVGLSRCSSFDSSIYLGLPLYAEYRLPGWVHQMDREGLHTLCVTSPFDHAGQFQRILPGRKSGRIKLVVYPFDVQLAIGAGAGMLTKNQEKITDVIGSHLQN